MSSSTAHPPLRVLLIHNRYRLPGGEDAVFAAERDLLLAHGHAVTVYERSNAELSGLQKLLLPFSALFSLRTLREVRGLIREKNIQLVHVHNTLSVISPSVFWAAFAEGVPVVQTLHNFRLLCPNGILLRDGRVCEDCPRHSLWCAVRHGCYRGSRAQSLAGAAILALHRALHTYRRVWLIAITPFDRDLFLRYNARLGLFDPARLCLKPHGLPDPDCSQPPRPWAARTARYLYVGRLEELKGIRALVESWQGKVPLLVAGDGPLRAELKALAVGRAVTFLGQIAPGEVDALMADCRGVFVPSLCYESFSLVTAQALLAGTPVAGSSIGNVNALVGPGDGVKFAPGDPAAIAAARDALEAQGPNFDLAAIRRRAAERFGRAENYRLLMEIYDRMLREGPA